MFEPAPTMNQWVGQKQRPTQFGDYKTRPKHDTIEPQGGNHGKVEDNTGISGVRGEQSGKSTT